LQARFDLFSGIRLQHSDITSGRHQRSPLVFQGALVEPHDLAQWNLGSA
jgi:hypothetical protein